MDIHFWPPHTSHQSYWTSSSRLPLRNFPSSETTSPRALLFSASTVSPTISRILPSIAPPQPSKLSPSRSSFPQIPSTNLHPHLPTPTSTNPHLQLSTLNHKPSSLLVLSLTSTQSSTTHPSSLEFSTLLLSLPSASNPLLPSTSFSIP
jgi:hypothetical protein